MILKLLLFTLALSILSNSALYLLYRHEKTKLQTCKEENKTPSAQLTELADKHQTLKKLCELDKQKIEQKYSKLLQKAMQPPKVVEIPVILEKEIFITDEDCQKLGVMIDEAVKLISSD